VRLHDLDRRPSIVQGTYERTIVASPTRRARFGRLFVAAARGGRRVDGRSQNTA